MNDEFTLYDLEVSILGDPKTFACSHKLGYAFSIVGENLTFVDGSQFSLYAMAALLPLIPAKQRVTHANDWMSTDDFVRCPDPNCGAQFKLAHIGKTTFRHSEVTKVPLKNEVKSKSTGT